MGVNMRLILMIVLLPAMAVPSTLSHAMIMPPHERQIGTAAVPAEDRKEIEELQRKFGPNHPRVAEYLTKEARAALAKKDYDTAEQAFARALSIYEAARKPIEAALVAGELANLQNSRGRTEQAEALYLKVLETAGEQPKYRSYALDAFANLQKLYLRLGQKEKAAALEKRFKALAKALASPERTDPVDPSDRP
jgi:tetratricopeptide (TPR) repeat protein